MSIIFDFKAIRQDAAALGIRTIGEDTLPKAKVVSPPQQQRQQAAEAACERHPELPLVK